MLVMSALLAQGCGGSGGDDNDDDNNTEFSVCSPFRVINGSECQADNIPVVLLELEGPLGTGVCTGTVISNDFILTAAHCVSSGLSGAVVRHDRRTQEATEYGFNPLFLSTAEGDSRYDVALIKVPGFAAAAGLTPVAIGVSKQIKIGDTVSIIGFGTDEAGDFGSDLPGGNPRATSLKVADTESGLFATLYDDTETSPCFGDSGGSAVKDGIIVGVESAGTTEDCRAGDVNIFTAMNVDSNIEFIRANVPGVVLE